MMMTTPEFSHVPVLLAAVLEAASTAVEAAPHGSTPLMVDCTVGGAGHARALLEAFPTAQLVGLDRDPTAIAVARANLAPFGARARVVPARFSEIETVLSTQGLGQPTFVLADFGVSSHQLDTAERGFSFRSAGPLDMRMNPAEGVGAAELLATIDEADLAHAIKEYGEERHARRVARAIVQDKPQTTEALAGLVRRIVPKGKDRIDQATRTFQAIRILVNDELGEIETWLAAMPRVLADLGVVAAISFHSLEDRPVKLAFRGAAKGCICPPTLPMCGCGHKPTLRLLHQKARQATPEEINSNPRARSAKLRTAQRLARSA